MITDWQKSQKMGNQTSLSNLEKTLMRKLDINLAGGQAHWIKYRIWFYKKKKKKKDTWETEFYG